MSTAIEIAMRIQEMAPRLATLEARLNAEFVRPVLGLMYRMMRRLHIIRHLKGLTP